MVLLHAAFVVAPVVAAADKFFHVLVNWDLNPLSIPGHHDVARRDLGPAPGAFALSRLA